MGGACCVGVRVADESPFRLPWQARLVCDVVAAYPDGGPFRDASGRVHLACMKEPWASYIADGSKVVESRWGKVRCAPHGCVSEGDVVIWKRSGGAVYGASVVVSATTIPVRDDAHAADLLRAHGAEIHVDPNDGARVAGKRWLTLIRVGAFVALPSKVACGKNDQAGWNVLQGERGPGLFGATP
jgi:hypothetical protein